MIFTFGTGGDTNAAKKELYEALQYSGLVTEDMTYEEMCEALDEYFAGLPEAKTICSYDYEIAGLTWTTSGLTTGKSNGYRYIGKATTNGSATSNIIDNSEGYAYVRICPVGMEGCDRTFAVYDESGSQLGAQFAQSLTAPIKIATKGAKKIKIGINFSTSQTNASTYLTNVVLCNN